MLLRIYFSPGKYEEIEQNVQDLKKCCFLHFRPVAGEFVVTMAMVGKGDKCFAHFMKVHLSLVHVMKQ